jgi:hypothetical protein
VSFHKQSHQSLSSNMLLIPTFWVFFLVCKWKLECKLMLLFVRPCCIFATVCMYHTVPCMLLRWTFFSLRFPLKEHWQLLLLWKLLQSQQDTSYAQYSVALFIWNREITKITCYTLELFQGTRCDFVSVYNRVQSAREMTCMFEGYV